ncbi:MAG: peptidoglycan DD-metalloendopeptidase family protein [Candidatus Latescibacteria bacterium]|nr:peptidoglycan DD-metalloendopeptidase family protein [Candidatus Latescibacterota bacterium]
MYNLCLYFIAVLFTVSSVAGAQEKTITPLRTVVDLNIGESRDIVLNNGKRITVKVLKVDETHDVFRDALRNAAVTVTVNGHEVIINSATYHLPVTVDGVQIDCPITKGYYALSQSDSWGLERDVRLRMWAGNSPLLTPGTFGYPVNQRLFASDTQMSNEPVFVDAGEVPSTPNIYYHSGLDFGGVEGMVDVLAATDGLVVSKAGAVLDGHREDTPVRPRYDVIYLLDDRGWYYRYSHMKSHETNVIPGERVKMGQKLGELGKEGASGGWSHLHFEIIARQPSGKWGVEEGYAYIWEAYKNQYKPQLIAVARPHLVNAVGDPVIFNGEKSCGFGGSITTFEWLFCDGTNAQGPVQKHSYTQPGIYSEILKITDSRGNIDYDFTVVNIMDKNFPDRLPPTIHVAYTPTFDILPGDPVTFKARAFRTGEGFEIWDFGDGSPVVRTESNPEGDHAEDGYAVLIHRYAKAGHYIVKVERTGDYGYKAIGHVDVRVGNSRNQ